MNYKKGIEVRKNLGTYPPLDSKCRGKGLDTRRVNVFEKMLKLIETNLLNSTCIIYESYKIENL